MSEPTPPDWGTIDRILTPPHREDDQLCGCDECMSYGAEDAGFDWYRVSPARRIALRILDSGDDRLAELAKTIREHEAQVAEDAAGDAPCPRCGHKKDDHDVESGQCGLCTACDSPFRTTTPRDFGPRSA